MDTRRNHIGGDLLQMSPGEFHASGKNQGGSVGVISALKLRIVDDTRLVAQTPQRAPEHRIFLIGARTDQVSIQTPKKLRVRSGIDRTAQQMLDLDALHPPEHRHDVRVNRVFDEPILLYDAETAFAQKRATEKFPITPMEKVRPY